jgi:hypothetical protein
MDGRSCVFPNFLFCYNTLQNYPKDNPLVQTVNIANCFEFFITFSTIKVEIKLSKSGFFD